MENRNISLFFALLRFSVIGTPLNEAYRNELDENTVKELYTLGKRHDLAHLIGHALEQNGMLPKDTPVGKALQKEYMTAAYRYTQMQYEYQRVSDALEAEGIAFMPLKGAIMREYYAEPWMRTSCDVDILIHSEDVIRAEQVLTEKLRFQREGEGAHDVSLYSESGVHLELHFVLNDPNGKYCAALEDVWSDAAVETGKSCFCRMSDERFYLYHVVHMAKHFLGGGCGIRAYMDLWILNHRISHNREKRKGVLASEDLLRFATVSERLAEVWFSDAPCDDLSLKTQTYLLTGGVYGSVDNRVKVQRSEKGGRFGYLISRIFMPYDRLKYMYPILQKHRWLMPFMQMCRWLQRLFGGKAKRALRELNVNKGLSRDKASDMERFISDIGL